MATTKTEEQKSSFAGFLDGYKASNIASAAGSIHFHLGEIALELANVINNLKPDPANSDFIRSLERSRDLLANVDKDNPIPQFISLSEALEIVIDLYFKLSPETQKLVGSNIKKIIYHLLSVADKANDKGLLSVAIELGERF